MLELKKSRSWIAVGIFCLATQWIACGRQEAGPRAYPFQGETMGTTYTVKVVVGGELSAEKQKEIEQRIESELDEVNAKMSHYDADSELSRFNRSEDTTAFSVSEETFGVFREALEIAEMTGGAFDITVGPLVNLWGFGPDARPETVPSDDEIGELLEQVGYEKLELEQETLSLRKSTPALQCDLSAIAKGFGVDQVVEALDEVGMTDYMVEVGGEVRTLGLNDRGQAWRIGIERPISEGRVIEKVIALGGWAMATSGDYRNYYEVDGVRYSHMIDPRTGRPITHRLASVTVVGKRCTRADGLATALFILGPDEGYQLAVEQDLAVLFMVKDDEEGFRERATPAFERLVEETK
jgi:thiamine biosynthesis lipoprotein